MLNDLLYYDRIKKERFNGFFLHNLLSNNQEAVFKDFVFSDKHNWSLYFEKFYKEQAFKNFGIIDLQQASELGLLIDDMRQDLVVDLYTSFWKKFFEEIINHTLITNVCLQLNSSFKTSLHLNSLFLIRYQWEHNSLINYTTLDSNKLTFIYWVNTTDIKGDEIWFPDMNLFFKAQSNQMLIMQPHELCNYLHYSSKKESGYGYYIMGTISNV